MLPCNSRTRRAIAYCPADVTTTLFTLLSLFVTLKRALAISRLHVWAYTSFFSAVRVEGLKNTSMLISDHLYVYVIKFDYITLSTGTRH